MKDWRIPVVSIVAVIHAEGLKRDRHGQGQGRLCDMLRPRARSNRAHPSYTLKPVQIDQERFRESTVLMATLFPDEIALVHRML